MAAASRYRVVRRLGQGGMAEVFEAERHGELGFVRKVALKQLLPSALTAPMAAQRFLDESRIASQLHHANIVAVLDVGVLDDRPFQILELVEGLDADALLRRAGGALPTELALAIAHAVAHALDHAHTACDAHGLALGIVHRDVKPPNILLAWTGDIKLADFGIAVAHDRTARTETGLVAGTRGFLAPEQRMRGQLDGRTDVFALGLTLHALCTGASPLDDIAVEARLLAGDPLPLDPRLPDDVRAAITAAVAPDRRARPSAAQLADTLGHALAARDIRDPRAHLRDYLARLRQPARAPGALDLLLGIELVPVDAPGTVQRYATGARPLAPPPLDAASPPLATAPTTHAPPAPAPARPRRTRRLLALASLALAVSAAFLWRARTTPQASIAPAPAIVVAPVPAPPRPSALTNAPAPAIPPSPAPVPAPTHAPTRTPHRPALASPSPASPSPASPSPASPSPASPSSDRGYVQVVGEDLLRARVKIDGIVVGYVPNRFAVPVGRHRIEVERPDGTQLPARDLDVTTFHTAQRPARPRW